MPGDYANLAFVVDEDVVGLDVARFLTLLFEFLGQVEQLEQQVLQFLFLEGSLQADAIFNFALERKREVGIDGLRSSREVL